MSCWRESPETHLSSSLLFDVFFSSTVQLYTYEMWIHIFTVHHKSHRQNTQKKNVRKKTPAPLHLNASEMNCFHADYAYLHLDEWCSITVAFIVTVVCSVCLQFQYDALYLFNDFFSLFFANETKEKTKQASCLFCFIKCSQCLCTKYIYSSTGI